MGLCTDLSTSLPAFDFLFQQLLLCLQHAAFLTQLRVGLLQWQDVRLQLLHLNTQETDTEKLANIAAALLLISSTELSSLQFMSV